MTNESPTPTSDEQKRQEAPVALPVPFYNRPLFWGGLVLLTAALAAAVFWPRAEVPTAQPAPPTQPDSVLTIQKARNEALEKELARLRQGLKADPCAIPDLLGPAFDAQPLPQNGPQASRPGDPLAMPKDPGAPGVPDGGGNGTQPAPTAPPTSNPRTVGALMEQSTVFIFSIVGDGARTGTGFFVAPGIIATNRHVVGAANAKVLVTNKELGGIVPAQIIAISNVEARDYALLRIAPDKAARAPFLRMTDDARRTDRVSAWGFPAAVTGDDPKFKALMQGDAKAVPEVVYSEGVISVLLNQNPPLIVHTALISQGNSGGPLVNEQGAVLGINTMISLDKQSYRQTGLSLSGGDLMNFMREHGVTPSIAPAAPATR